MNYIISGEPSEKECPNCEEQLIWQEYGKDDIVEYGLMCENNKECDGYELLPEELQTCGSA
jgi:hypothetical protein|tara:strand:- start:19 stop:201 length:183 start_codon:yes stop_codon:yes gene_type:complete